MKLAFAAILLFSIVVALNYVEASDDFEFDGKLFINTKTNLTLKR
jgi:hypothetical protein